MSAEKPMETLIGFDVVTTERIPEDLVVLMPDRVSAEQLVKDLESS